MEPEGSFPRSQQPPSIGPHPVSEIPSQYLPPDLFFNVIISPAPRSSQRFARTTPIYVSPLMTELKSHTDVKQQLNYFHVHMKRHE
jgi:hypothetical protein